MKNPHNYRPCVNGDSCNTCRHQTPDGESVWSATYKANVPCYKDAWLTRKDSGYGKDWPYGKAGVCDLHKAVDKADSDITENSQK